MKTIFGKIGSLIEKYPFKVLLSAFLIFFIIIALGVPNIKMSTGNDTLVQEDNEVYISNHKMETDFGGDSILILLKDETGEKLFDQENIQKMWNIEKKFQYEDNIYSFMSLSSIVHQMTDMQSEQIKENVSSLSDGLGDMSSKMNEIGEELANVKAIDLSKVEEKLNNLSSSTEAFEKLINGQNKMNAGVEQLETGLNSSSKGLSQVSEQLKQMSYLAGENPELQQKLLAIAENIEKSAQGIGKMGESTKNLQEGTTSTAKALENISTKLSAETNGMKGFLSSGSGIKPEQLKEMSNGFITMGENLEDISTALSTFHGKSNMMIADIPQTQEDLDEILYEEGELRSIFDDVVIDENNALMVIKLQGNLSDEHKAQLTDEIKTAIDEENFESISTTISGKPVLDTSLKAEMKTSMMQMVALAVVVMIIVLMFVFRVRWRMLSIVVIVLSVIATIGLMSLLDVPITMVSMAVFPILIGLGIDYSIQFHSRFEEEGQVKGTLKSVGRAVAIAVLATALGFVSLYVSPVPMIQDFGKMLTIGVAIAFLGAVVILMPILYLRNKNNEPLIDKNSEAIKNDNPTLIQRVLVATTKVVTRFWLIVLVGAVVLSAMGFYVDSKVGVETDIEGFMPQDMDALQDIREIREVKGSTDQIILYLEDENVLSEENVNWIRDKISLLIEKYEGKIVDIKSIDTVIQNISTEETLSHEEYVDIIDELPENQLRMFVDEDYTKSVVLINIEHLDTESLETLVEDIEKELEDAPLNVVVTGKSVLDVEMVKGLTSGRIQMTLLGLLLVLLVLTIVYRNIAKAIVPVIPVALIVGMSSGIMYLLGIHFTPITSTLGALILGMGTEMSVMLMERYIEERLNGMNKFDAIVEAASKIGVPIFASGLTTVGGFSVLLTSNFVILKDFGLMTVINISLALLCTFIVLPPLIILFDRFLIRRKKLSNN